MKTEKKTRAAEKVLEMMDAVEDGGDRFSEFLDSVSKELCIPKEQIKEELKKFI